MDSPSFASATAETIRARARAAPKTQYKSSDTYLDDLGSDNRPASLTDYQTWFADAGLAFQILHLHGNVALMAGAPI